MQKDDPTEVNYSEVDDSSPLSAELLLQEGQADPEDTPDSTEQVDSAIKDADPLALTGSEESLSDSVESQNSSETKTEKKSRKWMSIPRGEVPELEKEEPPVEKEERPSEKEVTPKTEELPSEKKEVASKNVDVVERPVEVPPIFGEPRKDPAPKGEPEKTVEDSAMELPKNISDMLEAAEVGIPMMLETIISKKTTVYVSISEAVMDSELQYINLTGIRNFTGRERRVVGGCLDLSNLDLTGEEAKEVIQRMSKHKFHKLDLRNNRITEFPTNTFGPVAFTVKELRLDGNPLLSNCHDEGNMLQRGGLFHLTELRELNLSRCGLKDIDFFTPWNSNHLEVVDLSDNGLSAVPSNLQFFHKLKKLHMDGNPITEVGELPFALLWNLQVLTMSNCRISSIDSDPFRNMDRLKLLNLQSNNLTRIGELRLSRSCSTAKMYVSGNPWHCACDMLMFVERYNYAVRDLEQIRCASPRWLEGLRAAYLTKEILSLDSIDGSCLPTRVHPEVAPAVRQYAPIRAERLEVFAVVVFALAAVFMLVHISCSKRREKLRSEEHREDINYIRIDKKPNFK
ncbi:leucine-rich repeat-containing protein 70-like [Homalodisca vitripennis]|uniref:leucine-rich repeat-containing protein 70-like n=1 Tax=Homalodisca vitripennis TaxID=197043 RepID=UPI001EEC5B38|nr:leucine-rich repeat-containing protein 70-like [Homalodisca vitripennis]